MTWERDQDDELVIQDEKPIEDPDFTEYLDDDYESWNEEEGIPDEQLIGCGSDILASRKKKKK